MIDFISRYVSAISLIVVAALSIFNIGYFWKIGLHFIGLIDLTNLIYSAGLALSAIFIALTVAWGVVRNTLAPWKLVAAGVVGTVLAVWGIWTFRPRTLDPQLSANCAILIGFAINGTAALAWSLKRYRVAGAWEWRDLGLILLFACAIAFQAGSFAAALELSNRLTYSVTTKSGDVFPNARILRSASAGFIFAIDGQVVFVPQAEIRNVKSVYEHEQ